MTHRRRTRAAVLAFAQIALLLFAPCVQVSAQSLSDYQVKAAYIYNFAKFVQWPQSAFSGAAAPIRFCILNDHAFEQELNQIVKGKAIAGHAVDVIQVQDGEQARACHVLFVNSAHGRQMRQIVDALHQASVLTVGETEDFIEEGGIITFVVLEERVQFEVNHRAAHDAGLYISARLLGVAKRVFE